MPNIIYYYPYTGIKEYRPLDNEYNIVEQIETFLRLSLGLEPGDKENWKLCLQMGFETLFEDGEEDRYSIKMDFDEEGNVIVTIK